VNKIGKYKVVTSFQVAGYSLQLVTCNLKLYYSDYRYNKQG